MNKKIYIYFSLTILISVLFGLYLSISRSTDPFLYYDISYLKSIQDSNTVKFPETGPFSSLKLVPGRVTFLYQLMNLTGIQPENIQFLPIGSLIIGICFFVLLNELFESPIVAFLTTIYLTLNLSHAWALYSVFAYSIALPLFFAQLLIYKKLNDEKNRLINIFLFLIIFVALQSIHYTIASWYLIFFIFISLVWLASERIPILKIIQVSPFYSLTLAMLVIFFYFNQTFYDSYLPNFGAEILSGALDKFFAYFSFSTRNAQPYEYVRPIQIGLISTITLILILMPIIIGLIRMVWGFKKSDLKYLGVVGIIVASLLVIGISDILIYSVRGSVSTKSISLLFPVVAIYFLARFKAKWIVVLFALLLAISSLVKFGVFYSNDYYISNKPINAKLELISKSAKWLDNNIKQNRVEILTDLSTYGKYLLSFAGSEKEIVYIPYNDNSYAYIINLESEEFESPPDVVAIDISANEYVIGFLWSRYNHLNLYQNRIQQNSDLSLFYNDGSIWMLELAK